ncbi:ABC transporter ATP-binding protein [Halobaculum gomorrense]|nr:ATP-binding cassette domain-containing protein [Halobaculum gomorrense]
MIHAADLRLQYPTRSDPTLQGVSFTVDDGETLGVVGAVESGKTSLSMALAGFAPTVTGGTLDGELQVAGADPREDDDDTRLGMVFEDYSSQLTQVHVVDEVMVPLLSRGLGREAARERASEVLDRVRLSGYEDRRTWELSGGEQQRVAIAAALAMDAEALVFDTATRALDPAGREEVSNIVSSLRGEKPLVLTVTDPAELVGLCDRVLVLNDGEREAFGPAEEILRDADLLDRVGVRPPTPLRAARRLGMDASPITVGEFSNAVADGARMSRGLTDTGTSELSVEGASGSDTDLIDGPEANEAEPTKPAVDGGATADGGEKPLLSVEDLRFSYREEPAIDGIDLSVEAGEVHALVGGNGAGKSTLVELIVGLLDPDEGEIRIDGEPTAGRTAAAVGETVALSFQNPDEQLSKRTVEEEIRFPLEERQYDRGWLPFGGEQRYDDSYIDERVEAARERTGLGEDLLDEDPTFLPQGYRRLAAIASAIAPDPDVVILDEPAAGLDAEGYDLMEEAIAHLADDGKAVLVIEHDMDFVSEVSDRVTLLSDGTVAARGPPSTVFDASRWDELRAEHIRPPRAAELAECLDVRALTLDSLVDRAGGAMEVHE